MPYLSRHFTRTESSAVSHVGYHTERRQLYVTYRGKDEVYVYLDVPRRAYDDLLTAESIGTFVNRRIKPRYKFQHLDAA